MLLVKRTCLRVSKALLAVVSSFCLVVKGWPGPSPRAAARARPYYTRRSRFFVYSRGVPLRPPCFFAPILVPKPLSRLFSLWLVLVGSLYLLHIARGYVVV